MKHRLRHRYGRATGKGGPKVVYRMPTGGVVWAIPHSTMQIMWAGPGSRLKIGHPMQPGGMVTTIDHPTADGNYTSSKQATAAVKAFLEAK